MEKEQRVVVVLPMRCVEYPKQQMVAARVRDLGLTGYGTTVDEAKQKVKRMFAAFVAAYRERGMLEKVLTERGVKWCWESEWIGGTVDVFSPGGKTGDLHSKHECNEPHEISQESIAA